MIRRLLEEGRRQDGDRCLFFRSPLHVIKVSLVNFPVILINWALNCVSSLNILLVASHGIVNLICVHHQFIVCIMMCTTYRR